MVTLRNNGRPHRMPRTTDWWKRGEERDVADDIAAKLLESGRFSKVDPPLVAQAPVAAPVKKAAAKPKTKRRRKKPAPK